MLKPLKTNNSLTVSDLTPNVGMWWYFFTEMFDHFRPFFLGVFQVSLSALIEADNSCIILSTSCHCVFA